MNPKRQETPDKEDRGVASEAEVRAAIEGLSKADNTKLMLIARGFARTRIRDSLVEAQDLLQEAIVKTLDGRRAWKRNVSILKHLDRVMESDAGHIAERRATQPSDIIPESADEPASPAADPSVQIVAQQELADLLGLFAGDEQALKVLNFKREGFSASEIQQELGISKTHYDTVTKRIRRSVARHLAKEIPKP
jgi:DNA-directed RNA polymerase specialized sigma24 family protein